MKSVFLGGTCNNSLWRDSLIEKVNNVDFFNPVVPNWNEEAYQRELIARKDSDYCLYVITPKMTGVYSIAEVVDDSNKRPNKTLFHFTTTDEDSVFDSHQIKSLKAVGKMIVANGGNWFETMDELIDFLNK